MGNETFYGDGLSNFQALILEKCRTLSLSTHKKDILVKIEYNVKYNLQEETQWRHFEEEIEIQRCTKIRTGR